MTLDYKNAILTRLREIDVELKALRVIKIRTSENWVTGGIKSIKYYVTEDKYQERALLVEKKALLNQLDSISSRISVLDANKDNGSSSMERDEQALQWGVDVYITKNPSRHALIKKDRPFAREIVDQFFPELKGRERLKKIDSIRNRLKTRIERKLKIKKPERR